MLLRGVLLLIFDWVGRIAALVMAGVTLLAVIIVATLSGLGRASRRPPLGRNKIGKENDHARQEDARPEREGPQGL
jgi:hypothetical protein